MGRIYAAINEPSRRHGDRIRKTRLGLGMTQRELGEMFGIWKDTVSRIECGHYDITRAYPKHQILNERLRIWAEMNKGGRKRKYKTSAEKTRKFKVPANPLPRISTNSRYWMQVKKEKQNARTNPE